MANLIGTGLNQVPTNGLLGNMAFQNKEAVSMDLLGVSGRIGIGTTSPLVGLHVVGNNIRLTSTSDGNNGVLQIQDTAASTLLQIYSDSTRANIAVVEAKPMLFYTTNTERMRISATGDVGIGTSAPIAKLSVGGTGFVYNNANSDPAAGVTIPNQPGTFLTYNRSGGLVDTEVIYGNTVNSFFRFTSMDASGVLTERLRLNSAGNVGIGTASPGFRLTAAGASTAGSVTALAIENPSTNAASEVRQEWRAGGSSWAYATASYNSNSPYMAFGVSAASSAPTERMRLDALGNLGLGVTPRTTTATYKAFEFGQSGYLASVASGAGISLGSNFYIAAGAVSTYSTNGAATNYEQSAGAHYWYTAASGTAGNAVTFTQAMTLNASGNLGVGVTPSAWDSFKVLQVGYGAIAAPAFSNTIVTANAYYGSGSQRYIASSSPASLFQQADGIFYWRNAIAGTAGNAITFTTPMVLDLAGNLGIGTTSPLERLHLNSASAVQVATRYVNSNTTSVTVGAASDGSAFIYQGSALPLILYTNAAERMRITSAGDVGIGTSSPSYRLDVAGGDSPTFRIYSTFVTSSATTAYAVLHGNRTGTGGAATELRFANTDGAASVAETGVAAIKTWRTAVNKLSIAFETGAAERMRITDAGNVQVGTASLVTTATDGFPYIPTCAGTPTGTPTAITGYAPMVVDSTNNKLYVYVGGAWQAMN